MERSFRIRNIWVGILSPTPASFATLDKFLKHDEPQFPCCKTRTLSLTSLVLQITIHSVVVKVDA